MLESGVIDRVELPSIMRAATAPLRTNVTAAWTRAANSRRVAAVAGGLVVLVVAWIVWPEDPTSTEDPVAVQGSGEVPIIDPTDGPVQSAIPSADAAKLAEVDRMLLTGQLEEADKLLTSLRDQYPDDPVLLWRQGRLMAKLRRKEAQALGAYGEAIDHNAGLLEDRDFYAELYELLRNRRIRDEALDLALHKMGEHGHKFLLEVVNDQKDPLGYSDRHRALDELSADEENAALVNDKLNFALDLLQATQSLTPCAAYREAIEQIAAEPDPYYYNRVKHAPVPEPPAEDAPGTEGEPAESCEGLAERRDQVLAVLVELDPAAAESSATPDAPPPPPAKPAAKKSSANKSSANKSPSKKSSSKNKSGCDKPFAIFSRKCRK
jgi:hypothetical protein